MFDRNRALLMKVKQLQNYLYKILMKDYQHFSKASFGISSKKGKKKLVNWEKKKSKNRVKKKLKVISVGDEQPIS